MEYLSVAEAAQELGMTAWGVLDRIRRGDMRADRLGRRVYAIPREEVDRWKALGRQKPGPKPKLGANQGEERA